MQAGFLILALALLLDRYLGDPDWLWSKVPHPVVIFGTAIGRAEKLFNRPGKSGHAKRRDGFLVMLALLFLAAAAGWAVHVFLRYFSIAGMFVESIIASIFLAQKSLADHVFAVIPALQKSGLAEGRKAISMIVGRDPDELDEPAICRAAIESLAENSSDGIVAPAFWFAIGGLPGLFAYKMLNTADSMIGHMSVRYVDFGRFAAKLDDAANWIPARLTGLLMALAAMVHGGWAAARQAFTVMQRDARMHSSPNAGWPEASMAGALGLMLGGPRRYGGDFVNAPVLNGGGRMRANLQDVGQALALFWTAMTLLTLLAGFLGLL